MATKIWNGSVDGDYGAAGNWTPSGVPIAGDDVFFTNNAVAVTAGLDQSAVVLSSFTVNLSYTGTIGTETTFLQIASPLVDIGNHIGAGSPNGSGRLNLDLGSTTAATVTIEDTESSATDTNRSPLRIIAANASTNIFIENGKLSIADAPDQTATIGTLEARGGETFIGQGVTVTTATYKAGTHELSSTPTTLNVDGGTLTTEGSGGITTANIDRTGKLISNATGTVATLNALGGDTDFLQSTQSRTITTLIMSKGSKVRTDPDFITITNNIQLNAAEEAIVNVS